MSIVIPDSIMAANQLLGNFLMTQAASLPLFVRERLIEAHSAPSSVDRIVRSGEALYAAAADLDPVGKAVCGALIGFATLNSWHGLNEDNRGGRIVMAMRRDTGEDAPEGMAWPEADTDPAAKPEFVEPATEDPAALPAPPAGE